MELPQEIKEIILDYLSGNLDTNQQTKLDAWIENNPGQKDWIEQIFASQSLMEDAIMLEELNDPTYWKQMEAKMALTKRKKLVWKFSKIAAVFIFLLTVGLGTYYTLRPSKEAVVDMQVALSKIKPGGYKAFLRLADGKMIILNNIKNGSVVQQGSSTIIKSSDQLIYNASLQAGNTQPPSIFNTLITPLGGEYKVTLPDGTKVWLNACSQLKYPVTFSGSTREVWLDGEAYFEVAKNAKMPFYVKVKNKADIRVLGTHFNIMAYSNEPVMQTTLVEGRVEVLSKSINTKNKLSPGQQAILSRNNMLKVVDVDAKAYTLWKDGFFLFNNEDLGTIMRKLSRWYDVRITFDTKEVKNYVFFCKIKRYETIDKVLNLISKTDKIDYTFKDNIIKIRNK